jgi:FkbM family methyltransferase
MVGTLRNAVKGALLQAVKRVGREVGLEIKRHRNELTEENILRQLLSEVAVDYVVDVGANEGQYAKALRSYGYRGPMVSFEPLPDAHARLLEASRDDPGWEVPAAVAIGAERSELTLNVAGNSASSSFLPMLKAHVEAAPHSTYVSTLCVPVVSLDEILCRLEVGAHAMLLKIDTQGFEDRVLAGASRTLTQCAAIQVEISLAPLYEGQANGATIIATLDSAGFRLAYIVPGFREHTTGRLLQFDGIFVRDQSTR